MVVTAMQQHLVSGSSKLAIEANAGESKRKKLVIGSSQKEVAAGKE